MDYFLTLTVLSNRKVENDRCIRFDIRNFRLLDAKGRPVDHYKGNSGIVIRAFDQSLFFYAGKIAYALDEIPRHEQTSKNFDFVQPEKRPRKRYVPPTIRQF